MSRDTLPMSRFDEPLTEKVGAFTVSTIFIPSRALPAWEVRWETVVLDANDHIVESADGVEWTLTPEETWALRAKRIAECAVAELRRLAEEAKAIGEQAGFNSTAIAITAYDIPGGGVGRKAYLTLHGPAGVTAVRAAGPTKDGEWKHGQRSVDMTDGHAVETFAIETAEDLAPALAASLTDGRTP